MKFRCPYCPRKVFDSLAELGDHLSKTHGLNDQKRLRIYTRMRYGVKEA